MCSRSILLLFFAMLASESIGLPQEPVSGIEPRSLPVPDANDPGFSLEQLQKLALENNPTLVQARAETWKAYGKQQQAGLYPNPVLGYSGQEIGSGGTAGMQGFYVSQQFITGGKLELSRAVAFREQQQAEQVVSAQEFRIVNGVRREYYDLLTVNRKIQLAEDLLNIAIESQTQTERRLQGMQGSRIDVLQARLERERVHLELETLKVEREAISRRLKVLAGIHQEGELIVAGDLEADVPDLDWESALSRLLESSPSIAQAEAGVYRAAAVWQRAKAEPIPDVTLQAGTMHNFETNRQIANVQVSLPIPVFNKNQGNISAAEAEWIRASHEVERVRKSLERELADVFRGYAQQRIRVMKFNTEILPASWETLDLSRKALAAEEINSLQFLSVQRSYTGFNQEYVEALGEIWRQIVAIDGLLLLDGFQAPASIP
ncbi:MAG TPA: TolC family protein [Planctomycetaceae bacterium]|nr:TolC family protein [Planctomycetaceae bacterium]